MQIGDWLVERDDVCWILAKGRFKRKDRPGTLKDPHYFGTIQQLARKLVDMEAAKALEFSKNLEELSALLSDKIHEMVEAKDASNGE